MATYECRMYTDTGASEWVASKKKRRKNRKRKTKKGGGKDWGNMYLEYNKGNSHKFWEITRDKTKITTRWGKLDTKGRELTRDYGSVSKEQYLRMIDAKKKKGYVSHWKKPARKNRKRTAKMRGGMRGTTSDECECIARDTASLWIEKILSDTYESNTPFIALENLIRVAQINKYAVAVNSNAIVAIVRLMETYPKNRHIQKMSMELLNMIAPPRQEMPFGKPGFLNRAAIAIYRASPYHGDHEIAALATALLQPNRLLSEESLREAEERSHVPIPGSRWEVARVEGSGSRRTYGE